MKEQIFQALLADFFRAAGCADAHASPGIGRCRCFGRDVALFYDNEVDPAIINGYVDLGTVPARRQREVFRRLLLRNPSSRHGHSAVLGLDAASGHIVLVARIVFLDALDGACLAATLGHWIREVFVLRPPLSPLRMRGGRRRLPS